MPRSGKAAALRKDLSPPLAPSRAPDSRGPRYPVNEDNAWVTRLPGSLHHAIKHVAGAQALHDLARPRMDQLVLTVGRERLHEAVGDGERDVEVGDLGLQQALAQRVPRGRPEPSATAS